MSLFFHFMFPQQVPHLAPFAIVSMLPFFGAAGKVPISVLVTVVKMTGSLQLLPGAIIAVAYYMLSLVSILFMVLGDLQGENLQLELESI